jgi:hypothetical protein
MYYYILINSLNMVKKYKKSHNYNLSTKLYTSKEIKKKVKIRLKIDDTPVTVYRDLVNNAFLSLFSAFVHILDMVKYWKKCISMKDILSGILPTYLFLIFLFFLFLHSYCFIVIHTFFYRKCIY